jgi:hypothetical protein
VANKTQQQIRDEIGAHIEVGEVFTIQGARILWPNFSGAADKYNSEGDRNFNLHLTKEQADELAAAGWNVKCKFPRPEESTEEQEERCVLKVTLKFRDRQGELKKNPPQITMIGNRSRNRTMLGEDLAGLIDASEIVEADVSWVPYFWESASGIGVAAYLRKLYVVVQEDELDEKWGTPQLQEGDSHGVTQ